MDFFHSDETLLHRMCVPSFPKCLHLAIFLISNNLRYIKYKQKLLRFRKILYTRTCEICHMVDGENAADIS